MMKTYLILCSLFLSGYALATPPESDATLRETLETLIEQHAQTLDGAPLYAPEVLAAFYAERDHALAWTEPDRLAGLRELVEASALDGFAPEDFHASLLRSLSLDRPFAADSPKARATLDIQLSDALLRYVHHTRFGKLDPVAVDPSHNDRQPVDALRLIADMQGALSAQDLIGYLNNRFSLPFWYHNLRRALDDYLAQLKNLEGLTPLPRGEHLGLGSYSDRVILVRQRLERINGQTIPIKLQPQRFDAHLRKAVIDFQQRFGLSADGIVGPATLAALDQPFDPDNIERIRINLERMRWLYDDLPPDYVFVDVADYRIDLVRDGKVAWSTRAVVGAPEDQTAMFRDAIDHLVINPTWTVPISIQKTMGSVSNGYLLVDRRTGARRQGGNAADYKRYQLVQQPGPKNALGRVKFMFPNRHAIYLHDTPAKHLFKRERRAFSHGCIRVEHPFDLAEKILAGSRWDRSDLDALVERNKTRYLNLDKPLPVVLYYLTAFADADGAVAFRPDIYARDPALIEAFAQPVTGTRIRFPQPEPPPATPNTLSAELPREVATNP